MCKDKLNKTWIKIKIKGRKEKKVRKNTLKAKSS